VAEWLKRSSLARKVTGFTHDFSRLFISVHPAVNRFSVRAGVGTGDAEEEWHPDSVTPVLFLR